MAATLIDTQGSDQPTDTRLNILGLGKAELKAALSEMGVEPKKLRMRASQIFQWMYHHGVHDFAQMTNIAKPMQAKLAEHFSLARPEIIERQVSVDSDSS